MLISWSKTGENIIMHSWDFQTKLVQQRGLVVCNNWDLESLDLLNNLASGCYKPSLKVGIVKIKNKFCSSYS